MTGRLQKNAIQLLQRIGKTANSMGMDAFLAGGTVRDLLLGAKNLDLDIVVEGEAIKLGEKLSQELNAALVVHKSFGTCTLVTKDNLKIDLTTARKETYKRPAAFPTVEFSSLKDDLARRDFTINAMAISLNKENFGQLIDFFGGARDLSQGVIRVMHDGSFIDDPTRIFRAVRFERRFGFSIDARTLKLIKAAIRKKMLEKVSKGRIQKEMILINKEKNRAKMLDRLREFPLWHYSAL